MTNNPDIIKETVKEQYAKLAKGATNCCTTSSSCCSSSPTEQLKGIGYTDKELETLPTSTTGAAAGCGNPTGLAEIKNGDVVLDLGSGGGIDVFLASDKTGPKGKVIGVDMTEEMIQLARGNAEKLGVKNVEFRQGEIENIPVEDGTVDLIISNCVINLSPDKKKVFSEAYRVLKPRGRIVVSDITLTEKLPKEIKEDPRMWASCVAGALLEKDYIEAIKSAGFKDIELLDKKVGTGPVQSITVRAFKQLT
jgi:SAM-dependent methyltransferase